MGFVCVGGNEHQLGLVRFVKLYGIRFRWSNLILLTLGCIECNDGRSGVKGAHGWDVDSEYPRLNYLLPQQRPASTLLPPPCLQLIRIISPDPVARLQSYEA